MEPRINPENRSLAAAKLHLSSARSPFGNTLLSLIGQDWVDLGLSDPINPTTIRQTNFGFDLPSRTFTTQQETARLSLQESRLIVLLATRRGRVVFYEDIGDYFDIAMLEKPVIRSQIGMTISRLKNKINADALGITNIPGSGYRLD